MSKKLIVLGIAFTLSAVSNLSWSAQNIYSRRFSRWEMSQLVGLVQKFGEQADPGSKALAAVVIDGKLHSWNSDMDLEQLISKRTTIYAVYYSPDGKELGCRTPKMLVASIKNVRPVEAEGAFKQLGRLMRGRMPDPKKLPSCALRGFMAGTKSGWLSHAAALDLSTTGNLALGFESGTRGATHWSRALAHTMMRALRGK